MKLNKLSLWTLILVFMFVPKVFSQTNYSIKEMTPEIKSALDDRKGRFDELQALKAQGDIGENNRGYVELLSKENTEAQSLIDNENKDRRFIYMTIVEQNNLSKEDLTTIENVFAQVQRDKANVGERIQSENGDWVVKEAN